MTPAELLPGLSGPLPIVGSNLPSDVYDDPFGKNWQQFLEHRRQLVDEILNRINLGQSIQQDMPDLTADEAQSLADTIWSGSNEDRRMNKGPLTMTEWNHLIGAARYHGIEDPESIPAENLQLLVDAARAGARDKRLEEIARSSTPEVMMRFMKETLTEAAAAIGIGALDAIVDVSQRIPFLGDALAQVKAVQEADRWLAKVNEAVRGDLTEDEATGYGIAKSIGGMTGYLIPGTLAWRAAGALGRLGSVAAVGGRMSPIARSALRGAAAEWMLEGGGDAPLEERAFNILLGTGFGTAMELGGLPAALVLGGTGGGLVGAYVSEGDMQGVGTGVVTGMLAAAMVPRIASRLRKSFPSQSDPYRVENMGVYAEDGPIIDLTNPMLGSGSGGVPPGSREIGMLPGPGTALDGPFPEMSGEIIEPLALPGPRGVGPYEGPPPGGTAPSGGAAPSGGGPTLELGPGGMGPDRQLMTPQMAEIAGLRQQVSDLRVQRDEARRAAETDGLTGLGNRDAMMRALPEAEADLGIAVVAFDAKGFKAVNDNFGHDTGDQAIANFADALRQAAEEFGIPLRGFRPGGDEFVALVPQELGQKFARRVEILSKQDFEAGVSTRLQGYAAPTYAEADGALMQFKRQAGGREAPQPTPTVVAYRFPDGEVVAGRPGESHLDLLERSNPGASIDDIAGWAEMNAIEDGFIINGQFMNRSDAAASVGLQRAEPAFMGAAEGLHSSDITVADVAPSSVRTDYVYNDPEVGLAGRGATADAALDDLNRQRQAIGELPSTHGDVALRGGWLDEPSVLTPQRAASDAINMSKQQEIISSPALANMADRPRYNDVDVAEAAIENHPGRVVVVRNVQGDLQELRQAVQERMGIKLMPHQFRVVKHPDGHTDLLIGAGRNLSNKQVNEYKQWGMFSGQLAVVDGLEVEILAIPSLDAVTVRPRYGGTVKFVHGEHIMPINRSGERALPGAAGLYKDFKSFVQETMYEEGLEAGLPEQVYGWLSTETSSQVPRLLDEWFQANDITDRLEQEILRGYFERRRLNDFKQAAPQALREVREINERIAREIGPNQRPKSTEDIASEMGFIYERNADGTGVLRHELSDLEVSVDSPEAAEAFLRNFHKEMPDITPVTDVPVEVMETLGTAGGSKLPPRLDGGAVAEAKALEDYAGVLEKELKDMEAEFGGGGGGEPPQIPPFSSGGPYPHELPPGRGSSLASQIRNLSDEGLSRLMNIDSRLSSLWLRYATPFRALTLKFQQQLQEAGLEAARLWQHYNDIAVGVSRAHNDAKPWYEEASDIISVFKRFNRRSGRVVEVMEAPTWNDKLRLMDKYGFNSKEREAVQRLRVFYDKLWGAANEAKPGSVNYIFDYVSHVQRRIARGLRNPYEWQGMPREMQFFAEYARHNGLQFREMDIGVLTHHWIRSWKFNQHVGPAFELMRNEWLHPAVAQAMPELHNVVEKWLETILRGYPMESDVLIKGISHTLRFLGVPATPGDVHAMIGGAMTQLYRSALGLRPDVWFRDSIQPLFTGTKIGFQPVRHAYNTWLQGGAAQRREMLERAMRGGWVEVGQVQVPHAEIFQQTVRTDAGLSSFTSAEIARREAISRVGDWFYDLLPRRARLGIQGTAADPLLLYTKLGEFNRLISGEAGWQRAKAALDRFNRNEIGLDQLMRESAAGSYDLPIQTHARELIQNGDQDGFLNLLANEAANFQFRYGTREGPIGLRTTVGRMALMYGTFTTQFISMMQSGLKGKGVPTSSRVGFALRNGAVISALYGASQVTGWDFGNWMWFKSLAYGGGPPLTQGLLAGAAAAGAARKIVGERPTIEQEAATTAFVRSNELRGGTQSLPLAIGTQFFPYTGGIRTAAGFEQAFMSDRPAYRTIQFGLTGRVSAEDEMHQIMDEYYLRQYQQAPPGSGAY